jgi:hypothetical protein
MPTAAVRLREIDDELAALYAQLDDADINVACNIVRWK